MFPPRLLRSLKRIDASYAWFPSTPRSEPLRCWEHDGQAAILPSAEKVQRLTAVVEAYEEMFGEMLELTERLGSLVAASRRSH